MKSVLDRVEEIMQPGVERTPKELASELHCSYSTARTALISLYYKNVLAREQRGTNGQYTYFVGAEAGGV